MDKVDVSLRILYVDKLTKMDHAKVATMATTSQELPVPSLLQLSLHLSTLSV